MKKRNFLMLFVSVCMLGFMACNNDEPAKDKTTPGGGDEPGKAVHASLKGSNYYLFAMDETSKTSIPASKIVEDCRIDDINMALYVWENTYVAGTTSGPNFYGEVEGWTSLSVGSVGWSGAGLCTIATGTKTADLTAITADYTFHIAMKSQDNASHIIQLVGGEGVTGSLAIGSTPFVDGNKTYQPVADFARDGEWHEIEIPMSKFFEAGLIYRDNAQKGNLVVFLSGGTAGKSLQFDAMFIYKK